MASRLRHDRAVDSEPTPITPDQFDAVLAWTAKVERLHQERFIAPRTVAAGSELEADDRVLPEYLVSNGALSSLSIAVDCLRCASALILSGSGGEARITLWTYGPSVLLRAALENAAWAIWQVGPADRDERLRRRLRSILSSERHRAEVIALKGEPVDVERIAGIQAIADRLQLGALKAVPSKAVVVYADQRRGTSRQVEGLWRALSGVAHGDTWAIHSVPVVDVLVPDEYRPTVLYSMPYERTMALALAVTDVVEEAVRVLDRRRLAFTEHGPMQARSGTRPGIAR